MKKAKNIHNLDTLEKEIYRLRLSAKNIEEKLDNNFEHPQQNYSSMFMNFFFAKRSMKKKKEAFSLIHFSKTRILMGLSTRSQTILPTVLQMVLTI